MLKMDALNLANEIGNAYPDAKHWEFNEAKLLSFVHAIEQAALLGVQVKIERRAGNSVADDGEYVNGFRDGIHYCAGIVKGEAIPATAKRDG